MLRQLCDNACESVLSENNGFAQKWSEYIVFIQKRIASVVAVVTLMLGVNGPLVLLLTSLLIQTSQHPRI